MHYINAIALLEIVGFVSMFVIIFIVGIFDDNNSGSFQDFVSKNVENGVSLKMLLLTFAVMAIILVYYKII